MTSQMHISLTIVILLAVSIVPPSILIEGYVSLSVFWVLMAAFIVGFVFPNKLTISGPGSELIFSIRPLSRSVARIHLNRAFAPFTAKTYLELFDIVEFLPTLGVKTVEMSSPLFAKNGVLRSTALLKKNFERLNVKVEHTDKQPGWITKVVFMFSSALNRRGLLGAKWSTIVLQLPEISHAKTVEIP
ncbi:hypothetical protein M2404_003890 [Rheinheimera pacifica]|uniref:hypothetical protein n=1 Tax=Rheinheimera pacifica TaxID=173990 RepID=UPI002169FBC3|nr:hypothetical protein [Rheinheimera pacifica]MCS4309518.1 hypothetical protein [Rheinheimera pacifica]